MPARTDRLDSFGAFARCEKDINQSARFVAGGGFVTARTVPRCRHGSAEAAQLGDIASTPA